MHTSHTQTPATVTTHPATWRRSSRSTPNGACVEMANVGQVVAVRDSKLPDHRLTVTPSDWSMLLASIKTGAFQRP